MSSIFPLHCSDTRIVDLVFSFSSFSHSLATQGGSILLSPNKTITLSLYATLRDNSFYVLTIVIVMATLLPSQGSVEWGVSLSWVILYILYALSTVYLPRIVPQSWLAGSEGEATHGPKEGEKEGGEVNNVDAIQELEMLSIDDCRSRARMTSNNHASETQVPQAAGISSDSVASGLYRRQTTAELSSLEMARHRSAEEERPGEVDIVGAFGSRASEPTKRQEHVLTQATIAQRQAMRGQMPPLFMETLHPENPIDTHEIRARSSTEGSSGNTRLPASLAMGSTCNISISSTPGRRRDTLASPANFETAVKEQPFGAGSCSSEPVAQEGKGTGVISDTLPGFRDSGSSFRETLPSYGPSSPSPATLKRLDSDSVSTFPLARRRLIVAEGKEEGRNSDESREDERPKDSVRSTVSTTERNPPVDKMVSTSQEDGRGRDKESFLSLKRRQKLKESTLAAFKVAFYAFEAPLREFNGGLCQSQNRLYEGVRR